MKKSLVMAAGAGCLLTLVACMPGLPVIEPQAPLEAVQGTRKVLSAPAAQSATGNGPATIILSIAQPIEPPYVSPGEDTGYHTLATVHRWVEDDIFQYEATLTQGADTPKKGAAPPFLVIPQKGPKATHTGMFTGLTPGKTYEVQVVARGNQGGTAATQMLVSQPCVLTFDFKPPYANGPTALVEQPPATNATKALGLFRITRPVVAKLIPVTFSGTGNTRVHSPSDGEYRQPTTPERGDAL